MAEKQRRGRLRWIALGTILGVVAVWGGFGLVGAATSAPSAITTCTKASNGKTKVIATSAVAKCTSNGKGFAKSWTDVRYSQLSECAAGFGCPTTNFTGLDLRGWQFTYEGLANFDFSNSNLAGANFSTANLNGAKFRGVSSSLVFNAADIEFSDFTNANFTSSYMYGVTFHGDTFNNTNLSNVALGGATISSNNIIGNIVFNNTQCPDYTNSNADGGTCYNNGFS